MQPINETVASTNRFFRELKEDSQQRTQEVKQIVAESKKLCEESEESLERLRKAAEESQKLLQELDNDSPATSQLR